MRRRIALDMALAALGASIAVRVEKCNPVRHGQDEYRCTTCGKVWDTHEPKPDCERD